MTEIRCLTLFSGTHSVTRALGTGGFNFREVTLDMHQKADLQMDILDFDHTMFKPKTFNLIWASPDCTQYSKARTTAKTPRALGQADSLVLKTLEIIDYLEPDVWVIENPESGLLKTRPFMLLRPYYVADYCKYDMGYRKRTAFWCNIPLQLSVCCPGDQCEWVIAGKHVSGVQDQPGGVVRGMTPEPLLISIFEQALQCMQ
jgi:hypothetical protein